MVLRALSHTYTLLLFEGGQGSDLKILVGKLGVDDIH